MIELRPPIPATAQDVFDAVARELRIPWRPTGDPEVDELAWAQLVRENRVPPEFGGLINDLEKILHRSAFPLYHLHTYALAHNLDPKACTQ